MWRAVCGLVLAGCGPVMLGEEVGLPPAGGGGGDAAAHDAAITRIDAGAVSVGAGEAGEAARPMVVVQVKPIGCGPCFDLEAQGGHGVPPYVFEWEDGSRLPERRACVGGAHAAFSVIAVDAAGMRSLPQTVRLEAAGDASCSEAADAGSGEPLCLVNPSLEGTPAITFDSATDFNAPPWSPCTNPVITNTPDIGNEELAVTAGVPPPTDGLTFIALGEGEQVSQTLCSPLSGDAATHLELDLARVNVGEGVVPQTEQVFLEIWGGLGVDCTQRELLWASDALEPSWKRLCVTLRPTHYTTQLTLRANADMTQLSPAYLLVDNIRPVNACP